MMRMDEYDCVDEDEDGDYSIPKNNDNENELISMRIEKNMMLKKCLISPGT